tara:strand:- start:2379 stop:2603 length:225 start_codon:yes stop_codon:yes gene_type:complete
MSITKTESYKATDGSLHRSLQDAVNHELSGVLFEAMKEWGDRSLVDERERDILAQMMASQPYRSQIAALFNQLG